jgi:hypothetical protein
MLQYSCKTHYLWYNIVVRGIYGLKVARVIFWKSEIFYVNLGPSRKHRDYQSPYLAKTNLRIFEAVTDTNMKEVENSMETHKLYVEMFDICSIRKCQRMVCEIRSRNSGRGLDVGSWSVTYPHRWKIPGSRGPRNGSCSCYPSLLNLRRNFPLIVIVASLATDMLQSVLPTKM